MIQNVHVCACVLVSVTDRAPKSSKSGHLYQVGQFKRLFGGSDMEVGQFQGGGREQGPHKDSKTPG